MFSNTTCTPQQNCAPLFERDFFSSPSYFSPPDFAETPCKFSIENPGALRPPPYNFPTFAPKCPKKRTFIFPPHLEIFLAAETPPSNPKFCVESRKNTRFARRIFLFCGPKNAAISGKMLDPPYVRRPRKGG